MKINDTHGFKILRTANNDDLNADIVELEHEKSGAKLIAILNEDPNKVFYAGFRTPSNNSTGVAHILEHSTLCGSKKYPVKEPFVELAKGSINTFLNAMTYPDKTVYPIATTNDKDFRNLMDVYLDAVFYPNIYNNPYTFKQEGWHYHLENEDEPVTINGVVYNEMKGVYSDPSSLLEEEVFKALYPDTIYSGDSGGNPQNIPELTYEDFIDFHKNLYHPSNSYLYLYGDLDLEEQLAYLDSWLKDFDKKEVNSSIPLQAPIAYDEVVEGRYPISPEEDKTRKDLMAISYVLDDNYTPGDLTAIGIVADLLFNNNASPLRLQILDARLAEDIKATLMTSLRQPNVFIEFTNTDRGDIDKIMEIINRNLEKFVKIGIDKELLQGAINADEFKTLEVLNGESGRLPKGLLVGLQMFEDWVYDKDPLKKIEITKQFDHLAKLLEKDGFEKLIKEVFLDNDHKATVVLRPDENYLIEREEKAQKELADYKASLSQEELKELVSETNELIRRQQSVDSPEALKTIPRLAVDEIDRNINEINWEELKIDGVPAIYLDEGNSDIVYVNLDFNAGALDEEDLFYLALYERILANIATEHLSYENLNKYLDLYTGDINIISNTNQIVKTKDVDTRLFIRIALREKYLSQAFKLLKEFMLRTRFDEKEHIYNLLVEEKISKKAAIQNYGNSFASLRTKASTSKESRIMERLDGLEFYDFLVDLMDHFEENWDKVSRKLQEIQDKLINKNDLFISFACNENFKEDVIGELKGVIDELPDTHYERAELNLESLPENEAFITQGNVMYNAKGAQIEPDEELKGAFNVLSTILSMDYLWNAIRVLGGAYGTSFKASREGDIIFSSFRDPNLKKTYENFDNVVNYIDELDLSRDELDKYIVGTMSPLEVPLSTKSKLLVAEKMYLTGYTNEDQQKVREQILDTQLEDLKKTNEILKRALDKDHYVTIGTESEINKNKDLFKAIERIQ